MAMTSKLSATGIFIFIFGLVIRSQVDCLQCLSQNNEPVDWYIAYKLSYKQKNVPHDSFFYMDAQSPKWTFSNKTMKDEGQAIYNTLDQIYRTSSKSSNLLDADLLYLMYNDQHPKPMVQMQSLSKRHTKAIYNTGDKIYGTTPKKFSLPDDDLLYSMYDEGNPKTIHWTQPKSILKGHTKGVIGFDSQKGFWLIHSIPHFPPIRTNGYKLQDNTWGQTLLCISMKTDVNLDQIGLQLLYNYPDFYDKSPIPSFASKYPHLINAIKGKHVTEEHLYHKSKLTSLNGVVFHSFAKSTYFNRDLYADLLAPRFGSTLYVQSWRSGKGGKMVSNCTGPYKVFNVENMEFRQPKLSFKSTTDHSKWAVTKGTSSKWTCIGDINRMDSQKKRGGGATCFQNNNVWNNFSSLIK